MKLAYRSFAGGEITPELAGRLDLTKFQTGLQLARNFMTLPHGPATRRPGFEYVQQCRFVSPTETREIRLMPFSFSATQTAVLEFSKERIRFHIGGGTLLEAEKTITGWTGASPAVFTSAGHGYASGDWLYFHSSGGSASLIENRYLRAVVLDANTFNLATLDGASISGADLPSWPGSTFVARVYEISTPYAETDLFDIVFAQDSDVVTLTHPSYPSKELKRLGATNWTLTDISFAPTLAAPATPTVTPTVATTGNPSPQEYCVTAVGPDGVTESLASTSNSTSNDLTLAGNYNTISWGAVGGATRYYVYKRRGGGFGYLGQTTGTSTVDDNILPDGLQSPPENIIGLNSGANDYPQATTYHEQRRWFAGTNGKPQVVWATRTGTNANLTSSLPSRDADGMEFRIASMQNNQIRHLVPLGDLVALTAGGEFRIFSDNSPAITPTTLTVRAEGASGASRVQPVITSQSGMYVQAQGSHVREFSYIYQSGRGMFQSVDMSIMAPHRFNGYTIKQLAYTRAPEPILWAVRDDGVLMGLTYVPEQQVTGWHFHDTEGEFESVCVVVEGNEDVLYAVVRRTIGERSVRYIERLRSRIFIEDADAFFVDSGLTYSGSAVGTVSGLWHLEGMDVDVLADGAVVSGLTVSNGAITLPTDASVVNVGLHMTSDLQTMPLIVEAAQAAGQGTVKNISKVYARINQSSVVQAGPSFDRLREYPARQVSDPYDTPPALRKGEIALSIDPSWTTDGSICIRQELPLPLTIVSLAVDATLGG